MEYIFFIAAMLVLFIILKVMCLPFKIIIKLLLNALIGGVVLYFINLIGARLGFVLDINWLTAIIVGMLGVPGVIIVVILHFFLF